MSVVSFGGRTDNLDLKDRVFKDAYSKLGLSKQDSDKLVHNGWANPTDWILPMKADR